jgi:Uma2 family endonuclease
MASSGAARIDAHGIVQGMSSLAHLAELVAPERLRPLRRAEFERMVEQGLFVDERIELLQGALVEMSPQHPPHAGTIQRLTTLLAPALADRAEVRIQLPLAVSDDSLPEPDVAVVAPGDYRQAHPTTALLVIEVAETSLNKDRLIKAALYAAAGVPEYWIVDLPGSSIDVYVAPVQGRYTRRTAACSGDALRPVALGDLDIRVADVVR